MLSRLLELIRRKLGVCGRCIRLSLILSIVFLWLYALLGGRTPADAVIAVCAGFFTGLFIAHAIAWLYRRLSGHGAQS